MQRYLFCTLLQIVCWVSLVGSLGVMTGCAGAGAATPQPSPSPTATPDAAHISTNPASLDFGSIAVGAQKTIPMTITNTRGSAGTVAQINASGAGFSISSSSSVPFSLAAGQSATLNVTFAPLSGGPFSGSVSFQISGGPPPPAEALTGSGVAAGQLSVNPASINFGSVPVGTTQTQSGSLTAGGTSIAVSSASWNGAGFSLSGITFPVTVPAGQSVPFSVSFTPASAGASSGSVSFVSNATNSPGVESLSGSGLPAHSVSLSWSASTSTIVGYNVYRGTQTGGPYTKLSASPQAATTYSDKSVLAGLTYFYVVTAVDSSAQESSFSNEFQALIPTP